MAAEPLSVRLRRLQESLPDAGPSRQAGPKTWPTFEIDAVDRSGLIDAPASPAVPAAPSVNHLDAETVVHNDRLELSLPAAATSASPLVEAERRRFVFTAGPNRDMVHAAEAPVPPSRVDPQETHAVPLPAPAVTEPRRPAAGADARPTGAPLPLGIASLDRFLEGGLAPGSLWLLLGPPFSGKDLLAGTFLDQGMRERQRSLVVLTDAPMNQPWQAAAAADGAAGGLVDCIDLRSHSNHDLPADLLSRYRAPKWTAQGLCRDVTTKFEQAPSAIRRFVWGSLSTFHAVVGSEGTLTAMMQIGDAVRRSGAAGLVLIDPIAHSVPELQFFKRQADGIIEMRNRDGHGDLRVEGTALHKSSPWVRFERNASGIAIKGFWHVGRIA